MEVQVSLNQLLAAILGCVTLLVSALVYLTKILMPKQMEWMRAKVDTKNGSIGELVEEVKRLSTAMCSLVDQGNQRQDQFMAEMREICAAKDAQIDKLMEQIRAAAERAA